jgi:phosphogluconate dehydratase
VTDGRMSGASGKVPAAIHVTPEALDGGAIGRIVTGDIVRVDAEAGTLEVLVEERILAERIPDRPDLSGNQFGMGRELFAGMRALASRADEGAAAFGEAA